VWNNVGVVRQIATASPNNTTVSECSSQHAASHRHALYRSHVISK